jgi:hypothetical protein
MNRKTIYESWCLIQFDGDQIMNFQFIFQLNQILGDSGWVKALELLTHLIIQPKAKSAFVSTFCD